MENRRLERQERRKKIIRRIKRIPVTTTLLAVLTIIFDFGYDQSDSLQVVLYWIYFTAILSGSISIVGRYFSKKERPRIKVWPFDGLLVTFSTLVLMASLKWINIPGLENHKWIYLITGALFVREFSALKLDLKRAYFNPAQLFILSFIFIILCGTFVLMLPNATHSGISFIDAIFTSTSAVCVTGLVVVDTGSYFTEFGQTVIIILIQLGGIGIMTFTSYFSYFFRGGSSYENQLLLKDMTNAEKVAEVFGTLKKIILLTFLIEAIGAVLIYFSLDESIITSVADRTFFSIFHTVSGFCNAGFSTLSDSLYETGFQFNYPLQLIISGLFIVGGIGFPILFNSFKYLKHFLINRIFNPGRGKEAIYAPWILNINTRIVLLTTALLVVFGTTLFYVFEYNNTLSEHSGFGKIVTAFFGAVTPRTAGFNTVDTSALNVPTIMMVFLLMWVGASPGSTGGGIKTSTFAIGTLNFLSIARGKDRTELFKREVADISVRRAFAIISLSLVVIGVSVFFIASFDSDKDLLPIAFECFSAYSTVGLSMGITPELSDPSKVVIIATMFIGRVSMLTILIAIFRKVKHLKYRYPTEEIFIN